MSGFARANLHSQKLRFLQVALHLWTTQITLARSYSVWASSLGCLRSLRSDCRRRDDTCWGARPVRSGLSSSDTPAGSLSGSGRPQQVHHSRCHHLVAPTTKYTKWTRSNASSSKDGTVRIPPSTRCLVANTNSDPSKHGQTFTIWTAAKAAYY